MRIVLALGLGVTAVFASLLALAQQAPPSRNVDDYVLVGLARVSLGSGRTLFAAPPELPPFTCAGSPFGAFVLPSGPTSLRPGAYGSLFAKSDVDIELAPGTYRFENIKLGTRSTLLAAGPVTVNVCGDLRLSNAVRIGFKNERSAKDFALNVAGQRVAFGRDDEVTAIVRAPNAHLRLGALQRLRGQFVANAVSSGPRVEITCDTGSAHCARVTTTTIPRSSTTTTTPRPRARRSRG